MYTRRERQMVTGIGPGDIESFGVGEYVRVAVGAAEEQGHHVSRAGPILDFATDQAAVELRTELYGTASTTARQELHLRTVAELHTRLTLSFIVTPHTSINLATIEDTRAYVRQYLLPMITGTC